MWLCSSQSRLNLQRAYYLKAIFVQTHKIFCVYSQICIAELFISDSIIVVKREIYELPENLDFVSNCFTAVEDGLLAIFEVTGFGN